jgi:predicted ArsR family transcriptional regulator
MKDMQGITVPEIAKALGITEDAVRKRIEVAGIQPKSKDWIYDESVLEIIKNSRGRGRPPKAKPEAPVKAKKGRK